MGSTKKEYAHIVRVNVLRGTNFSQGFNMVVRVQNDNYDKGGEAVYTPAFTADQVDTGFVSAIQTSSKALCLQRKRSRHGR